MKKIFIIILLLILLTPSFGDGATYFANKASADQGATTGRSIGALLAGIGTTTKATIELKPGTYTIGQNVDWSAYTNIVFKIQNGAIISHGTYTVNIPNPEAGLYQWLSGTGTVTFSGNIKESYPEWFAVNTTPGTTDMTAAISAAINATAADTVISNIYLTTSQTTIGSANKRIIFKGNGSIIRGKDIGDNYVFYATGKDNLIFDNPRMTVQDGSLNTHLGGFIQLYRCNVVTVNHPDLNGKNEAGQETCLRAIHTPDCNDVTINEPYIQYIVGSGCGADNATHTAGYGNRFTVNGGIIKNVVDTGIGAWTGAKVVRINGTRIIRDDYTNFPTYNSTGIDIAGAEDVDISADIDGGVFGIRALTNLTYTNKKVRIHNSSFKNQIEGTETGQGIKVSMDDGANDNMELSIVDNTFTISTGNSGIAWSDVHTGTTYNLTMKIDGNKFYVATGAYGIYGQSVGGKGNTYLYPGKNEYFLTGTGISCAGTAPAFTYIIEDSGPVVAFSNLILNAGADQDIGYVYLDKGMYTMAVSFGSMDDGASSVGLYLSVTRLPSTVIWGNPNGGITAGFATTYPYMPHYMFYVSTPGVHKIWADWTDGSPVYNLNFLHIVRAY